MGIYQKKTGEITLSLGNHVKINELNTPRIVATVCVKVHIFILYTLFKLYIKYYVISMYIHTYIYEIFSVQV